MKLGDEILYIEKNVDGLFEWEGVITKINDAFIETIHKRDIKKYPKMVDMWRIYRNMFDSQTVKHYFHPDGKTPRIKLKKAKL